MDLRDEARAFVYSQLVVAIVHTFQFYASAEGGQLELVHIHIPNAVVYPK